MSVEDLVGEIAYFDRMREERRRAEGMLTVYYPGVEFTGRKNHSLFTAILAKTRSAGRKFRVVVRTPRKDSLPKPMLSIADKVYQGSSLAEYHKNLHEADVCLITSETTTATVPFECMASGMLCLFLDKPWLSGLVPDDYAFRRSASELEVLMFQLLDGNDLRGSSLEARDRALAYYLERNGEKAVAGKADDCFTAIQRDTLRKSVFTRGSLVELVREAVSGRDGFTLKDAYEFAAVSSRSGSNFWARSDVLPHLAMRQILKGCGYEDDESGVFYKK